MKKLVLIAFSFLSLSAFASISEYVGSDAGAACTVRVDLSKSLVEMAGSNFKARKIKKMGNDLILEGGVGFSEEKVTLSFSEEKEITKAKLEVKILLMPTFMTKQICSNLVRTK